ncbi:hypothetical protein [Hymenobacter sp. APR13]|uniref:hypothetical protein n=1 Tax=Hymenobacter sp. APR13 TaxID=1356852 RepID=UPI0012E03DBA|nr:hypothetical protein [Hymenobacter sp. APR13]
MLTFLLSLLLSMVAATSAPPFLDIPVITNTSVGKAQIGMATGKLRELYKGCTFTKVDMARYGWYGDGDTPRGVLVTQEKRPFFVYFEDWEKPGRIRGIVVLHPSYRTRKNIGVGTTSGALRTAFPAITVGQDMMDDYNQNIQTASLKGSPITYTFAKQKDVGKYTDEVFDSRIVNVTAVISWITIFPK